MSNDPKNETGELGPKTDGKFRVPPRTWIVWISVFGGIILLMLFRDRMETQAELISQYAFEQKLESNLIAQATINYNPQNPYLNEIVGKYFKTGTAEEHGTQKDIPVMPFRAKVRLTAKLENKLLSMPQFEVREPNTVLLNVIWSVLPIIILAALIWFFFVRQIRRVSRGSPSPPDLQ